MRILLIEDQPDLNALIAAALKRRGCNVDVAFDLDQAREFLGLTQFDAVVLDRRLPDGDGLALLPDLKGTPALVLSALAGVDQTVLGFEKGVEDYVAKPVHMDELFARLKRIARRGVRDADTLRVLGHLSFNETTQGFSVHGALLQLPRREHLALECLMRRPDTIVPHQRLEDAVFSIDDAQGHEALAPHLSRLRKKLDAAQAGVAITAMRGLGYILHEISDD